MKTTDNDTELKKMIKDIRLESPGPDFSTQVMQAVLAEAREKPVPKTLFRTQVRSGLPIYR